MAQTHPIISHPLDTLALRGEPDAPALILKSGPVSYAALNAMVGKIAQGLQARGLQRGDRVATWLPKTREACLMPLAAVRAGLVHVPINPLLKRAQVAHILADSGARLLVTQTARAALLDADDAAGAVVIADTEIAAIADGAREGLAPSIAAPDELAAILYTSGSTGRPKGVMLSHANLWLGAESVATYLHLKPDDVTLCALPFSFDYGQNQLLSSWYAGAAAVPFDYLTPRDLIAALARYEATTLAGVPPLWVQLVEQEWGDAVVSLRRITNSGGALTSGLGKTLRALLPKVDIYAMYGLTEAFRSTYLPPSEYDARPESIGKAIPHAEILVVRADGSITDPDEPGELVHAGPLVAQGYWQDAERTVQRFRPAPAASLYGGMAVWSGDSVRRDRDGYLIFIGRDDAMIKSAGNRISPTEIEEEAVASGAVAEAVALGVPDARLGAAIALVVRAPDGEDSAAAEGRLRTHLKAELPHFMQPAHIIWRDELPRNPNGKLDRVAIEAELKQSLGQ